MNSGEKFYGARVRSRCAVKVSERTRVTNRCVTENETHGSVDFSESLRRQFAPPLAQKGERKDKRKVTRPRKHLRRKVEKSMASNEKVRIKVKGYEHSVVDAAAAKIVDAAKRSGARVAGPIPLPTDKQVVTILRAVHKYKDSREQFEMRTHKRLIDVIRPSQKTIEALQSLELPAGVEISMDI